MLTNNQFAVQNGSLFALPMGNYFDVNLLQNVTVLGVQKPVSKVLVNDEELESWKWTYSAEKQNLILKDVAAVAPEGAWGVDWKITWI